MSHVIINVLTVPPAMAETLEQRFAARAGAVEGSDGFEHFELLRPVEGTDRYLVYTRWRDRAAFAAWQSSQDPARGHSGGEPGGDRPAGEQRPPAATGSEVWSYEVVSEA